MILETRYTTCVFCDGKCALAVQVSDTGDLNIAPLDPKLPAICSKVYCIDEYRFHPDRIVKPLKNVAQRGNAQWEEISWDQALDEIATRLQDVIKTYGPESVAFAETPLNHGYGGITRRLMNCIGTPNYTSPTQLCMGNTAQVHRAVYGWLALSDWDNSDCIVYFGQVRDMERWPVEYLKLKAALDRGATLVVVDPRRSSTAELAHHHVPIRFGTDAALALSWIHIIIKEELYDKEFVEHNCIGFEDLREEISSFTPQWASKICGVEVEQIEETARIYAHATHAIIPWGVVGDMQVNSTSLLHAQCVLRSICGYIGLSEKVFGPALGGLGNAQLSAFDLLSKEQRNKQLGRKMHPLLTFEAAQLYDGANTREAIPYIPDILAESVSCVPNKLFAAMRGEGPYDVKAIIVAANNTLMSYAGQQGIFQAFMNQDLAVVFDHWMTPTAQLADYVLPGDMWAERSTLGPAYDIAPVFTVSQALCEPVGECKSWYYVVKGLADRMGYSETFPWADEFEMFDHRLSELGVTWKQALENAPKPAARNPVAYGKYVTPSGKIELKSSVLQSLGFSPFPGYIDFEDPFASKEEFPFILFAGLRDSKSYNTNLHQIASLRKLEQEPLVLIHPQDAACLGIKDGTWCSVSSAYGSIELQARVDARQPIGTLRVPHGWWKPESHQGMKYGLSGAALHNDGMLFPDDDWNLDGPQGVPNLRGGIRGAISSLAIREDATL